MIARGLPGAPPEGETVLWSGAPDWRLLALTALHVRALCAYFAALALWGAYAHTDEGVAAVARVLVRDLALGAVPVGIAMLYAWASARSAAFVITDRRVVLRAGVALPTSFNLPFAQIASADMRLGPAGSGDLVLSLEPGTRHVPYIWLWPFARPWRLARAQPSLRALPDVQAPAQILARALAASWSVPVRTTAPDSSPGARTREVLA